MDSRGRGHVLGVRMPVGTEAFQAHGLHGGRLGLQRERPVHVGPQPQTGCALAAQGPSFTVKKAATASSPTRGSVAAERSHLWPVVGKALLDILVLIMWRFYVLHYRFITHPSLLASLLYHQLK